MDTLEFFTLFKGRVEQSPEWRLMVDTVEDSPWHREANVAVHTDMTIERYMAKFFAGRTERQRMLTLVALLFHDFGKPEAEETLEKKDQPGVLYRRYAGHEPISGNVFLSFMCDQHELRAMFFEQGYTWQDIRTIKVMIEHHLPYGLKNEQKRQRLKQMVEATLGGDETCFYDMLRSDAAGRISDDHETKLANVEEWIEGFQAVTWKRRVVADDAPTLILMVGISGAGKSTLIKAMGVEHLVFSEDALRDVYAHAYMPYEDYVEMEIMTPAEKYQWQWNFCHLSKIGRPDGITPSRPTFDQFSAKEFAKALETRRRIYLDRMNHGRKARGKFIEAAKAKGYAVRSIELFVSEAQAKARQKTRGDKQLPDHRVHQIAMQLETPWLGAEVDTCSIYIPS